MRTAFLKRQKRVGLLWRMLHSLRSWSVDCTSVNFLLSSIWFHFLWPASSYEDKKSASCFCNLYYLPLSWQGMALPVRWTKQGKQKNTLNGESFCVNSIIRAAVSRGSGCGARATFSIQREWQWCYKAQDHCSVVAVLSWYSLLPAVGFLLSLPFSFFAFSVWFFNLPKISVSYSIYAVINSFPVLSAITLTTNDPVEV